MSLNPLPEMFLAALQASPSGMAVVDDRGLIAFANPEFARLLRYDPQELVGLPVHDLVPENSRAQHLQLCQGFFANPSSRLMGQGRELPALRADGTNTFLEIGLSPFEFLGESFAICSAVDYSHRRMTEHLNLRERELELARRIQRQLLPQSPPSIPGLDIAAFCEPAIETGGDFYDFCPCEDGSLIVAVGDVSGHGFGPALVMAITRTYLKALVESFDRLTTIMQRLNDHLCVDTMPEQFVTLFLARIDPKQRMLQYVAAGHWGWRVDAAGHALRIESNGIPLGMFPNVQFQYGPPIMLECGDQFWIATDGIHEAQSEAGDMFGEPRLLECARHSATMNVPDALQHVRRSVNDFIGKSKIADDMTLVIIRVS